MSTLNYYRAVEIGFTRSTSTPREKSCLIR